MADFILGAIPENGTGKDQSMDQAAIPLAASSRAVSDPPTSVYASKTRSQALELQKTQPQALCFPTDGDNIVFNGKEWGVKPIKFTDIESLSTDSTSDEIKAFLGIPAMTTWESLRRKLVNGYPVCSVLESIEIKLLVNVYSSSLAIIWFDTNDLIIHQMSIAYTSSPEVFRVSFNSSYVLQDALTKSDVVDDLYSNEEALPLSSARGTWLNENKAGVITTHGLLNAIDQKEGAVAINVTDKFGFPFSKLLSRIGDDKCALILDNLDNYIFTSGTLICVAPFLAVWVCFDTIASDGGNLIKEILQLQSNDADEIICTGVFIHAYQ